MAVLEFDQIMTVKEYLSSSFEVDCDFVDGCLEERNLGEFDHARLQSLFDRFFASREEEWGVYVVVEQRVQVSPTLFRVPDVCLLRRDGPPDQVIQRPPLICIEILSPDDRLSRLDRKVDDYLRMGVENVWVIDPALRKGWVCSPSGWTHPEDGRFSVPGTEIYVSLPEIFDALDKARQGR